MNCKIKGSLNKEANPHWPPKLGSVIVMEHPNHRQNLFVGTVKEYVQDQSAVIILLMNNKHYIDPVVSSSNCSFSGKPGALMLIKTHGWKYVDLNKFNKVFGHCMNKTIGPMSQADMTIGSAYEDPQENKGEKCAGDDNFKDTSLLNDKGELQLEDLFREKEINQQLYSSKERFHPLSPQIQQLLLAKLSAGETIPREETRIIVNKNIAVRNMIDTKEDEINEGKKIMQWLKTHIIDVKTNGIQLFGDLKMTIFNGYVHFARKGIKVDDVITEESVPGLKYFRWQYGLSIDYDTLKYILFQSKFQEKIKRDLEEQKESERIFSQEYLIALQPEPQYFAWAIKRLILCWYADSYLQTNIRKIKVIINQWRCKNNEEFNQRYGILPSIVIYPRYGKESARKVLEKVSAYFMLYQSTAWHCATPSYFIKVNDLVYYTNGSLDLKLYYTKALASYDGETKNKSFNDYFSRLLTADKLLYPYKNE